MRTPFGTRPNLAIDGLVARADCTLEAVLAEPSLRDGLRRPSLALRSFLTRLEITDGLLAYCLTTAKSHVPNHEELTTAALSVFGGHLGGWLAPGLQELFEMEVVRERLQQFLNSDLATDPRYCINFARIVRGWARTSPETCVGALPGLKAFVIHRIANLAVSELFITLLLEPGVNFVDKPFFLELTEGIGTDRGYNICASLRSVLSEQGDEEAEFEACRIFGDSEILNRFLEKAANPETYDPLVAAECFQLVSEVNQKRKELVISGPVHDRLASLAEKKIFDGKLDCAGAHLVSFLPELLPKVAWHIFDDPPNNFLNRVIIQLLTEASDAEFLAIVDDAGTLARIRETFERSPAHGHIAKLGKLIALRAPRIGDDEWHSFVNGKLKERVKLWRSRYTESREDWSSESDDEFGPHRNPPLLQSGDMHDGGWEIPIAVDWHSSMDESDDDSDETDGY
jgi:hypothetical protein